ncbi:hypothetical protein FQA47_022079 [Oryzias melastigma]|uniref:Uncharacterized protein n=1 Tax=Oryzias melastigma TaxID=30732 RepID=A0A834FJF8_ORYME|nr:hypothetical protein FQA47_022079 [Oryzias melastigma]
METVMAAAGHNQYQYRYPNLALDVALDPIPDWMVYRTKSGTLGCPRSNPNKECKVRDLEEEEKEEGVFDAVYMREEEEEGGVTHHSYHLLLEACDLLRQNQHCALLILLFTSPEEQPEPAASRWGARGGGSSSSSISSSSDITGVTSGSVQVARGEQADPEEEKEEENGGGNPARGNRHTDRDRRRTCSTCGRGSSEEQDNLHFGRFFFLFLLTEKEALRVQVRPPLLLLLLTGARGAATPVAA